MTNYAKRKYLGEGKKRKKKAKVDGIPILDEETGRIIGGSDEDDPDLYRIETSVYVSKITGKKRIHSKKVKRQTVRNG